MRTAQSEKGTGLLDHAMLFPAIIIPTGNLKGRVYKSVTQLKFSKTKFTQVINSVSKDKLQNVSQNLLMHNKARMKAERSPPAILCVCVVFLQ
jgi:hypothetical protein